uniref:Uncharacterized protein n=1 Tax=Rhizophora mucronata TaxID=61149 RepID=A0A2P2R3G9_RHIMU
MLTTIKYSLLGENLTSSIAEYKLLQSYKNFMLT